MNEIMKFKKECEQNISKYAADKLWKKMSMDWTTKAFEKKYMYNFSFMDRPIIQTPIDMVAMQELIWSVKPDLIIETGIAHGGSLIMSAAMLAMIDYCEAIEKGTALDPKQSKRKVLGLDIDIRAHNKEAIQSHPMAHKIEMIQGSSVEPSVVKKVHEVAKNYKKILVCLDSNHTHEHVMAELMAYAPLTSQGSYCCVFDTIVEDLPKNSFPDRPWDKGNNPKTAVWEYLKKLKSEPIKASDGERLNFEIDQMIQDKLLITVAPDGYLKRV